jgi:hypothetical protein
MKPVRLSLSFAAAMIGVALLAVFDIVPQEVAQVAPIALPVLAAFALRPSGCGCLLRGLGA